MQKKKVALILIVFIVSFTMSIFLRPYLIALGVNEVFLKPVSVIIIVIFLGLLYPHIQDSVSDFFRHSNKKR